VVQEVVEGLGVRVRDAVNSDSYLLADVALAEVVPRDSVLGCRTITPRDSQLSMTTWGTLRGGPDTLSRLTGIIQDIRGRFGYTADQIAGLSPDQAAEHSACIIRAFLDVTAPDGAARDGEDASKRRRRPGARLAQMVPVPAGAGWSTASIVAKVLALR